jgi:hypothetical protein
VNLRWVTCRMDFERHLCDDMSSGGRARLTRT